MRKLIFFCDFSFWKNQAGLRLTDYLRLNVIDYEHGLKLDDKFYRQRKGMLKALKLFRILLRNVLNCAPEKIIFP